MAHRKALTETQQQRVGELREACKTFKEIAAEIGCCVSSVNWCCTKLGITIQPQMLGARGPAVVMRGGREVRRFSADEDARILQLRGNGAGFTAIAREVGRPTNSVIGRLYTLARYQAAAE